MLLAQESALSPQPSTSPNLLSDTGRWDTCLGQVRGEMLPARFPRPWAGCQHVDTW